MSTQRAAERYDVRNGPSGRVTDLDWNIDAGFLNYDDCITYFDYPGARDGFVPKATIIYRFTSTFKDEADEYYILARSSRDRRIHVFQQVSKPSERDLVEIDRHSSLCIRSDREWGP